MSARVPMMDLKAHLRPMRAAILKGWARTFDAGSFVNGPEMKAFEVEAAAYAGVKHAIACNSGTDALVLLLRAHGIGPGDEVLVPAFSFFATAEAVSLCGARPVFCDIRDEDFLLDLGEVKKKLNARTKAVIPVHLFGLPMDLRPLKRLLKGRKVMILEDAAQAFGAPCGSGTAGGQADGGALSFYPTKNLSACGDAGMVLCNDGKTALAVRQLREHGSLKRYHHDQIGYNSRMDELQAVALRLKLPRLRAWTLARRRIAATYLKGLAGLDLKLPYDSPHSVWHQFTLRIPGQGRRDALKEHLDQLGISTAVFYPIPMHQQAPYVAKAPRLPRAEAAAREVLSLPIFPEMKSDQITRVLRGVRTFYGRP
ncbi:MAG: DegT/DnrJ/EryC1/StrS family aminotransferase [candidate division FCPU426 bacterium]